MCRECFVFTDAASNAESEDCRTDVVFIKGQEEAPSKATTPGMSTCMIINTRSYSAVTNSFDISTKSHADFILVLTGSFT